MKKIIGSITLFGSCALLVTPASAQTVFVEPQPRPIAPCAEGDSGFRTVLPSGTQVGINIPNSLNCGVGSFAQAEGATAVGPNANAAGENSTALGFDAQADEPETTAIGAHARATAAGATAVGAGASAGHANSTALGAGASTSRANEVAIGASGTSVRVGDIAASTAAQSGPVQLVTVDANGTLGRSDILPALGSLQAAQNSLTGRVDQLFDLRDIDRQDAQRGIAAAIAMAHPSMPSEPGRVSYVFNIAHYRGENAAGGAIMFRLPTSDPLAISAGFSFAGHGHNAMRVGVAGEF